VAVWGWETGGKLKAENRKLKCQAMTFRTAEERDLEVWVKLRHSLWPYHSIEELEEDCKRILAAKDEVCFLMIEVSKGPVGFIEGKIYPAKPDSYVHVEGWYVEAQYRRQGWGGRLVRTLEQWCVHQAIPRLTSDTNPDYPISPAAHAKSGFRTLAIFTIFCKELK
jgi:aminoglycoside 6'-N-acetyltransferase I